jgi:hypothetical protein
MAGNKNSGKNLKDPEIHGGRAQGSLNYRTRLLNDLFQDSDYKEAYLNGTILTPARFWFDTMLDELQPMQVRLECARQIAKYSYKAMPTETEVKLTNSGSEQIIFNVINSKTELSAN